MNRIHYNFGYMKCQTSVRIALVVKLKAEIIYYPTITKVLLISRRRHRFFYSLNTSSNLVKAVWRDVVASLGLDVPK